MDIVDLDYNRKTLLTKDIFPAMVFSIRNEDKPYTCVVSDNNMSPQKGDVRSLHIYINQHIFNNLYNIMINDLFYPILVHPIHSSAGLEDEISKHSAFNDRKIGALFVGNIDGGYNKNITRKLCGYTRKEIFFHVSNTLPGDILYFPKTIKEFEDKITTGELRHKIVLLDVQVFAIPAKKYFEILLESNFFIFMPGHIQPYCHNQIESMLAGCIPITHLKKFFFPPFENKYNSLLFDSLDSLTRLLNDVSRGEYESFLPFMRNNILNYYERNYSYQSLRNKISILIDNKIEYTNYYVPSSDIDVLNASI
jgi:hypothetical protein